MPSSPHHDPTWLPPDLPIPEDDGAADHLPSRHIPSVSLPSTEGHPLDLGALASQPLVLYVYPSMGRPGESPAPGWDETPGARGCTPQSCAFRDRHGQFEELGYSVAGLSAQTPEEQDEAARRLGLTFPLLADPTRRLDEALRLPTFVIAGMTLYKRLTLIADGQRVEKVFYPVFPPDENAGEVLEWIRGRSQSP
ncbi:hypothetical protein BH18ACT15_BH18ACT15_10280 [soil metagenome]